MFNAITSDTVMDKLFLLMCACLTALSAHGGMVWGNSMGFDLQALAESKPVTSESVAVYNDALPYALPFAASESLSFGRFNVDLALPQDSGETLSTLPSIGEQGELAGQSAFDRYYQGMAIAVVAFIPNSAVDWTQTGQVEIGQYKPGKAGIPTKYLLLYGMMLAGVIVYYQIWTRRMVEL